MGIRCYTIPIAAVLLLFISQTIAAPPPSPPAAAVQPAYINYIKVKCSNVTYPPLCTRNLYPYASYVQTNPVRLCNAALNAAIQGARTASAAITKLANQKGISPYEAAALKDCIGDVKDTIYELKDTLDAMAHLGDADSGFQWSNAKTWASAAISDAESCKDGFSGKSVNPTDKNKIITSISAVEKLISNALSLINHLY